MKFKVLTYNNFVGIVTDAYLIQETIYNHISPYVDVKFINDLGDDDIADVGIWIQNFNINQFNKFKKNIFFINEEWAGNNELNNLHLFDYVICKSEYAKTLLTPYCNAIFLPFISKDYYDPRIIKNNSILHFSGRSIQKNTELVLSTSNKLTIIDPYNRYKVDENVNHINTYQSKEQLIHLLNSHNIHICCSLYESWGHYLFEGLSTGAEIICSSTPVFKEQLDPDLVHFIPTVKNIDLSYQYDIDNIDKKFPLRKSFYIDEIYFKNKIENFEPIGKSEERRKLFNNIIQNNKKKLINFFLNF